MSTKSWWRSKIGFRGNFGVKQSPRNTSLRPSEQIGRTFWQVTQVKSAVVSTCLELIDFISKSHAVHRTMWQMSTLKDLQLRLLSLVKRYVELLVGLKTEFRGLCFTPKFPLDPIFTSSLTWCSTRLQQFASKTVDDSLESSELNILLHWLSALQNLLSVFSLSLTIPNF